MDVGQRSISGQFTELPDNFEDILNANINTCPSIDYDSIPSPGRVSDRPVGGARLDRRGSGTKGGNANFRPVPVGVLRSPGAQTPVQHHQYVRGILPGPTQSVGPQGRMQRNNSDADRWQRATNFQPKGLMPSPLTPLQIMHRAERKYEVGKVSDEEQAKQRQLKAILNKLTPQNFEKLFEQVKAVNIDNATTLTGVISQIFDKALMEPTFCEMYANFCFYLAGELPDFSEDNEKITFKRLLLNKCQEEFERGEREQEEANKADKEGEVKQSEEEREEKRIKARRRMLGNIRLIGELYKKKMLTERIMHECIKKLLGQQQTPDEEDIEALCELMSTIGEMIDHPKAKEHMDAYFDRMKSLLNNMKLSSRVRFMLKDSIDLRKNKWQQRRKVEGPKKIEEVHRDARAEETHAYESRTLSVPLTQRPVGDDSITLGPQGGLAEISPSVEDSRRMPAGLNGFSSLSEQPTYNPREDLMTRYMPDRFAGPAAYDQSSAPERNVNFGGRDPKNSDRSDDRSLPTSSPTRPHGAALTQNVPPEKVLSEDGLRDMSLAAFKEFYRFETVLFTLEDAVNDAPRAPEFPNGAHVQPQLHGGCGALVTSTAPRTTESVPQRSTRPVPKAPTSQSASVTPNTKTPTTPAKPPGDASKEFAFQFGYIIPSFMNGMQARHDSFRPVSSVPTAAVPKQQLPRKDPTSIDQPNAAEAHLVPKVKKDVQVSHAPPASQTQKPSAMPMAGISKPMPFHQQQVPLQFGCPNQQFQSQGMGSNSLQMPIPMPLPIGSSQVQQPLFVPGLQPHPMQSQGIIHQGQNLNFTPHMGPQMPQLGSMGISIAPQYPQQEGGKFGGPRKAVVKILHPDTHEELI